MFSTPAYVEEKGKLSGRGRFEYLQSLVTEFQDTHKQEAKLQILANLANFAYDPYNYEYLRQLNVIELFLDMLTESDQEMLHFGLSGLCNLCSDDKNREIILQNDGVDLVISCLSSENEETVLNTITTLMFLITPQTKKDIVTADIIECMQQLKSSTNTRLKNLAIIFLEDYCETPS